MRYLMILLIYVISMTSSFAAIVIGNPKGNITVDFVFDYQCSHCHQTYSNIQKLLISNSNIKVRLFPVALLNEASIIEGSVALVAAKRSPIFMEFNTVLMSSPILSANEFKELMIKCDFNHPEFINEMHQQWVKDELLEGLVLLKKYQARGVPLMLIYKTNHPNSPVILIGDQSIDVIVNTIQKLSK
jgi:hypothetical protein